MNVSSDGDDVTVAGKLFHTRAAAAGKAQSPTVDKLVEGTLSASYPICESRDTPHRQYCNSRNFNGNMDMDYKQ